MATYSVPLGESGDMLEIRSSVWVGTRLFYRGNRLKKGLFARSFKLEGTGGQTYEIRLKNRVFDSLPGIMINGADIPYAPPLEWWMYLISAGAILEVLVSLIVIGGILGAIPGIVAFYLAQNTMRSTENKGVSALLALVIVGAAWVIWVIWSFIVAIALYNPS